MNEAQLTEPVADAADEGGFKAGAILPFGRVIRSALGVAGWNAVVLLAGLAAVGAAGETWLRLTTPAVETVNEVNEIPAHEVPGVGPIFRPNAEVRYSNGLDFWTVSRTNSLGFLDREPPAPERAAGSCHVTAIGDSFVEALQVPISRKFHVRLEEIAARELPRLDVTTSAFGWGGTAQINQLPYYDHYARRLRPKLVVLVFVINDFEGNSSVLQALNRGGADPDHLKFMSARRGEDGIMRLRPPDMDHDDHRLPRLPPAPEPWFMTAAEYAAERSHFARWVYARRYLLSAFREPEADPQLVAWAELLSRRPHYSSLLDGWRPTRRDAIWEVFWNETLPPAFEEALEFTAFGLEKFQERAARDGASLVILATHQLRDNSGRMFDRLKAIADKLRIPVVDQYDYIVRQGAGPEEAHFTHDWHWNAAGHQWAAEALVEYLKDNQGVCDGRPVRAPAWPAETVAAQ